MPLVNFPKQTYRFQITNINDEKLVISLLDLKDRETLYECEYDFNDIVKLFNVLPYDVKADLINIINYQVFICNLVNKKKVEVYQSRNNAIRLEFTDIAPAPEGAAYNVSLHLPMV